MPSRVLAWILSAALLVACDSAPTTDSMATLKQVFAERPTVADEDNAFLDVFGFLGPADQDAHELGVRRVTWLLKFHAEPKTAGPDPAVPGLVTKGHRTQALNQIIDACRAAMARACSSALDRARDTKLLSEIEPVLLQRYAALLGRRGWMEIDTVYPTSPLPSYDGTIEAQRLALIRLRQVASGDAGKIRTSLERDLAFWRGVMASSDSLFSKVIALSAVRQHFALGSFVLHDLPADQLDRAIPESWRRPFTELERSMLRPMAGEFMREEAQTRGSEEQLHQAEVQGEGEVVEEPRRGLVIDLGRRNVGPPKLVDYANYYLVAANAYRVPLSEYETVSKELRGKYHTVTSRGWDVTQYATRVASAEGMRRAALLALELRSKGVAPADVARQLEESTSRNPYDGKPFVWDAADQAIVFTGPESRKYRRQSYPY